MSDTVTLKIERGNPTDDEIAALLGVLAALAHREAAPPTAVRRLRVVPNRVDYVAARSWQVAA
ncbi:acyl-CoA carboxylase epsilon subunit [Nocardia takedensis]|uniref:acyl-CoA carboxylase epsilon subunit n=1 Tax=Nocardia takedensis TaxID=259390 RepID=UPI00031B02AA|nr:acyl-CoA carboxylase epsilon subunit [Nocardia takedensis]